MHSLLLEEGMESSLVGQIISEVVCAVSANLDVVSFFVIGGGGCNIFFGGTGMQLVGPHDFVRKREGAV